MHSSFRHTTAALVLASLAVACAGILRADDVQRSFAVEPGDLLVVDVERAEINITSWHQSKVEFSAEDSDQMTFEFSQEDGAVTISGHYEGGDSWLGWFSSDSQAEIQLKVPYRQNLHIGTSGGDIELDRLRGEFTARTSGGDIEAEDIDGPVDAMTSGGTIKVKSASDSVTARTSGGSIKLPAVVGEIDAKTSGGRIRIGEAGATVVAKTSGGSIEVERANGAVQARTSGGSIEVGFVHQPDRASELRTSGGSVTVNLFDDMKANLSASTSGGSVSSEFPEASPDNSRGRGRLSQALNGGGPDLVLKTSGGSIRIRRLED